jgi:hypothetical protein
MAAPTNAAKREKKSLLTRSRPHMTRSGHRGPGRRVIDDRRRDPRLHFGFGGF